MKSNGHVETRRGTLWTRKAPSRCDVERARDILVEYSLESDPLFWQEKVTLRCSIPLRDNGNAKRFRINCIKKPRALLMQSLRSVLSSFKNPGINDAHYFGIT
jgi:hypothetical protein